MSDDLQTTQNQSEYIDYRHKEEEILAEREAGELGLPYINLYNTGIDTNALSLLTEEEAKALGMAPFKVVGKKLWIALKDVTIPGVEDKVRALAKNYEIHLYYVSGRSLQKAWERFEDISRAERSKGGLVQISEAALDRIKHRVSNNKDVEKLFTEAISAAGTKLNSELLDIILGGAIATQASDIHIEPQEDFVKMRYRQDGVLEEILTFDHKLHNLINTRLKLLAGMKLTTDSRAQDGRFTINYNKNEIEVRVSLIPSPYGESIVMRILNPEGLTVDLEQLGIQPNLLKILKREIAKPQGLILTTGPTGSGKTTTLYSFLKYIYSSEIKMMTIEDPIEYHLAGISQTQVDRDKGYDFLAGLRAALRQDPDVIMVGEIRDHETADTAINAALTGHIVLSTIHTNGAAGVVPRMLDLQIDPGIMADAVTVSLGQRLVRKLSSSKKEVPLAPEKAAQIKKIIDRAIAHGKDVTIYGYTPGTPFHVYEPVPTDDNATGYKGRIGIFEAILMDAKVRAILASKPSERVVEQTARHQGILTMQEDGVLKVLAGITSLDELERVVSLEVDESDELNTVAESLTIPGKKIDSSTEIQAHALYTAPDTQIPTPSLAEDIRQNISAAPTHGGKNHELKMLVEYLKRLEEDQQKSPETGAAEKISEARNTILELIESSKIDELFELTETEKAEHEISTIMQDLHTLELHQKINPTLGIARRLGEIRKNLEELLQ